VSSPLPSEIIKIDNTQRVMYKIDSPLSSVTSESIELSFKTQQSDGIIFYIRNNPIISYCELIAGRVALTVDTHYNSVRLAPKIGNLNDNRWHDIKLHRDGQMLSVYIDNQYIDTANLGHSNNILNGGSVYLGIADPSNINLSNKKAFIGEMIRGKVTINNVQQKVIQQPYWPAMGHISSNQTVNIDASQLAHDGKTINIVINVFGPPGSIGAGVKTQQDATTHVVYLDNLPNTRYISVLPTDRELDLRVGGSILDGFSIKFQTRQPFGALCTLINDDSNYIGLEVYEGYMFASVSYANQPQRFQISRARIDDGKIYQVYVKQDFDKITSWLDSDESYKQSIVYNKQPVYVNTLKVGGESCKCFGYKSRQTFVGCIGSILFNEVDVIDYQFVSTERRQSCANVIQIPFTQVQPTTTPAPITTTQQPIRADVSLGYINFAQAGDEFVVNYIYDYERTNFEDISLIFRTVQRNGVIFSAHNENHNNPQMLGAYLNDGFINVIYLNSSYVLDLSFNNSRVNDGNIHRLIIRRNFDGQSLMLLQNVRGVKSLDFYTQSGVMKFSKLVIGGSDEWARIRFFGTKANFVGCIMDLFYINARSVIVPAEVPKYRYSCNVVVAEPLTTTRAPPTRPPIRCLADDYTLSFETSYDAVSYQHETRLCGRISVPFRTISPRGVIYSHVSEDKQYYIAVFLRRGNVNVAVKDGREEKEVEFSGFRVDDGYSHVVDITCDSRNNFIYVYVDQNTQTAKRLAISAPIYLSSYTLGFYNQDLPSRFSNYDNFKGCLNQVRFNDQCLIHESMTDRNRLFCYVKPEPVVTTPAPITTKPPPPETACVNMCSTSKCLLEFSGRGYLIYQTRDKNVDLNRERDLIRFSFRTSAQGNYELLAVSSSDRPILIHLRDGELFVRVTNSYEFSISSSKYNDGKWHKLVLERNGQELIATVDSDRQSVNLGIDFDLYGDGRLYFGSSSSQNTLNNFVGDLKEVYVKYANAEYDIVASAKDTRIPGSYCQGNIFVKEFVDELRHGLNCAVSPTDSGMECNTDGACFASLWRNSSGSIERHMRCFSKEQLQPADDPFLCRSQDGVRFAIKCCYTDYCNRDLQLNLVELNANDGKSIWRFKSGNFGSVRFLPQLPANLQQSQLSFQFNTSRSDGLLFLTRNDNTVLRLDLKNGRLQLSASDLNNPRFMKTIDCRQNSQQIQFNDNKWHTVELTKRNQQVTFNCDKGLPQTLQYETDIPFVNTKYGVRFGSEDANPALKPFIGDLSVITYKQDDITFSFDDLQYSEDQRYVYDGYCEFRPKFTTEVYSDPKPIRLRSFKSTARLAKWDESRGRISFEFKTEAPHANGILFSSSKSGQYFAIVMTDGYIEAITSPNLIIPVDVANLAPDRYQRMFPFPNKKVNDGNWHKFELKFLSDSIGSMILDEDQDSKFLLDKTKYWNDESDIVFGRNSDITIQSNADVEKSFKGCLRNVVINNQLIDWSRRGTLYDIEAGCYNDKFGPNYVSLMQKSLSDVDSLGRAIFNGDGCIKYTPIARNPDREKIEFLFRTMDARSVLLQSIGSEFTVSTRGPAIVIRVRDSSYLIAERGIAFNDGNLHKIKIEKTDQNIEVIVNDKYKQSVRLTKRSVLTAIYFGCSKSPFDTDLNYLKGQILDLTYTSNIIDKLDLINQMALQDVSVLTDKNVVFIPQNNKQDQLASKFEPVSLKETNSFVLLDRLDFGQSSRISFSFKTNERYGLLGLLSPNPTGTNNFLAIELTDGVVSLLVNTGKKAQRFECNPDKLNDNKWHNIRLSRERLADGLESTMTLSCDNRFTRFKASDESISGQFIIGNASNFHVNLPWQLWQSKSPAFLGCIKDFIVSGVQQDLYQRVTKLSRDTLIRGCQDQILYCTKSSSCQNMGTCVEGFSRTFCNCDSTSFHGQNCELPSNTLSFNGSYGIEFSLAEMKSSSSEDIVLRFKTRLRHGVLFALKKAIDYSGMVLSLEHGRIKVVYDCGRTDKATYVGDHGSFNNNKWNTVRVRRFDSKVYVEVIGADKTKYHVQDDLIAGCNQLQYRYIEVGDVQSQRLRHEFPNFIGWIQNLRFNNEDLFSHYIGGRNPSWANINGYADIGENTLLLHHQVTFRESCPITLDEVYSNEKFNLHLFFKTSNPNGVLFFRRGKDFYPFMILELNNGNLKFSFDLGGGLKVLKSDYIYSLNDKNWHEVTIKRWDRSKFAMKVDDAKEIFVDVPPNSRPLTDLESFVIGGIPNEYHYLVKDIVNIESYSGCIASLEINGEALDLLYEARNICPMLQYGCVELGCTPNPCYNNGNCSVANNELQCNCDMTSYTGPRCKEDSTFYYFGGMSRLCGLIRYTLSPLTQNQDSDKLAFGFYTAQLDAVLARLSSQDSEQYMEVRLVDGRLNINIKTDTGIESKFYSVDEKFNDNSYHVFNLVRENKNVYYKIDNLAEDTFQLKSLGVFGSQYYVYSGAVYDTANKMTNCYHGYLAGMVFNGHRVLDFGSRFGDIKVTTRPADNDLFNITVKLLPDGTCPLGYRRSGNICFYVACPKFSEYQANHQCRCLTGYFADNGECKEAPEIGKVVKSETSKVILAPTLGIGEVPIGLILGIISGIALGMVAAALAARKCADGLCIPAKAYTKVPVHVSSGAAVGQVVSGTVSNKPPDILVRREVPIERRDLLQQDVLAQEEYFRQQQLYDQQGTDVLDFGYGRDQLLQAPLVTQSVNETMEMFEQSTHASHRDLGYIQNIGRHASHRDLAMDSMFYTQNATDYELSNVTCVTMTPNGKYAIIGQSVGSPQIWDTTNGQLVRSMTGACNNCCNLALACNGTLLVGLSNDVSVDSHALNLQLWEIQTGKPVQMTHQIKCCVFAVSNDTNSIFMAGNQRFGRGISVGILNLVTNELVKEIKSDPNISFGDNPETIVVTPDERHAIVACKSSNGTNFIVFDLSKTTEIAQTRSIALDANPKCIQVLNNNELLTGTRGGHIVQWNLNSCKPTYTFVDPNENRAHNSDVNQIVLSADKEYLASASSDGTAKVWNTTNKQLVSSMNGHHGEVSF
jgi:hypothetical protein